MKYVVNPKTNTLEAIGSFPRTEKTALSESIRKWRKIVRVGFKGRDGGPRTCALCHLYWDEDTCVGCPVSRITNEGCCDETPYTLFEDGREKAELAFLTSLYIHLYGTEPPE